MRRIAILGSTGSIGRSTLSVAESYPDRFQIVALATGSNLKVAFEQARRWRPRVLSIAAEPDADVLRARLKQAGLGEIEVVHGAAGTVKVATHSEADFVVSAIVGGAGLEATYEAVKAGKTVGVANKECLVCAGALMISRFAFHSFKQGNAGGRVRFTYIIFVPLAFVLLALHPQAVLLLLFGSSFLCAEIYPG